MKRASFWLLAISVTFVLGVAATLAYLKVFYSPVQISQPLPEISLPEKDSAELPGLTFCELTKNPEKYDGKTVRLSARLSIGLEGSWFSDNSCGADNAAIVKVKDNEVWKIIDKARERGKREPWDTQVNLIVIGQFKNAVYKDRCCLTTPFQFEISKVEKASKAH